MNAAQRFWVSRQQIFFSQIFTNVEMRLKFRNTAQMDLSKYLYREMLFQAKIDQNWNNMVAVGRLPLLKVSNFFSQIIIIS